MSSSQVSEKKRKRKSTGKDERPSKKPTVNGQFREAQDGENNSEDIIKFKHIPTEDGIMPVIVCAPGLTMPTDLTLTAYSKRDELLLQSSKHPRLDYVGREQHEGGVDGQLKHYIAIFDSEAKEMQLIEAKRIYLRSTLRSEESALRTEKKVKVTNGLSERQELGTEFGTKKAKKAIASLTDNAIKTADAAALDSPQKVKDAIKANPAAAAVIESMAAAALSAPDKDKLQQTIDASKPRPKHNPDASTAEEVYPVSTLVGEDVMRDVKVKPWFDAVDDGRSVDTISRFVGRRLKSLVENEDVRKVKLIRYLLVLMQFLRACKNGKRGAGKIVPKRSELNEKVDIDPSVLERVRRKFAPDGNEMTKWDVDNIHTHMVVISLIIDDFETDTFDLREDLHLAQRPIDQYFREVGAKVSVMTATVAEQSNLKREEAKVHKIAKLKLPLEFPKQRLIPKARGR